MTLDLLIRPAVAEDLEQVRRLLVETWHDTYDPLIGPEKVTAITAQWHAPEVLARQIETPDSLFLVAFHEAELVGHALAQFRQPPIVMLLRLYVLPRRQRRGIGGRLLDAVVEAYPGATALRLLVEADNPKGVSFYKAHGFEERGEQLEDGMKSLRMERMLA
jgi:ribosomal protein S18 acetylase RimI-like enzyme